MPSQLAELFTSITFNMAVQSKVDKVANPIAGCDTGKPQTDTLVARFSEWLRTLAEQPLDHADIHSICAHCIYKALGMVQARDYIEECLTEASLMIRKYIHPSKVGFDSLNREEMGGNCHAVHQLLCAIMKAGWSDQETINAVCAEMFPNDKTEEQFNQRLVADVALAPVPDSQLEYTSLGCGHTNAGLRAVDAECDSSDPTISEHGKLSKQKIENIDPRFAAALDKSLSWEILKYIVPVLYPLAMPIIIAAYNVYGNIQTKPS